MLLIEVNNIKKYYGDRLILDIKNLKIYSQDRIGIVGLNGAGKTTLMEIMSGTIKPDEGYVKLYGEYSYITQHTEIESVNLEQSLAREFQINNLNNSHMSGGEKTRLKIASQLSKDSKIVFADEPTCNLDIKGTKLLEEKLKSHDGALIIISHDRDLLDNLCNKILEVEKGKATMYMGGYSEYKKQKEMELKRKRFEYEQYISQKKKLENAVEERKSKARSMKKAPSRMGNSEARLHKLVTRTKRANIEAAVKSIETRLEHLEKKERVEDIQKIKIDISESERLHSSLAIWGENIYKRFGNRVIFDNAEFKVYNGSKTALIGDNGTGKTTLVKMIMSNNESINVSKSARIGYFSQEFEILDPERTILENVMENSIYPENMVRTLLARLLFKKDDVYKKVKVLSGGEKVKAAFAKIFSENINLIILDEPTNFLDVYSQEALEQVLREYEGTLLFISHDRRFINNIADTILIIENKKITTFIGNYNEYMEKQKTLKSRSDEDLKMKLMVLQTRLTDITSRLSMPSKKDDVEALDREYYQILNEIKVIKNYGNNNN